MKNNKNKYLALFGVLIVLIIPIILISTVYLTPKPKINRFPILAKIDLNVSDIKTVDNNSPDYFNEAIKVVFSTDSKVSKQLELVSNKTSNYPERTFKDRHSKIYYLTNKQNNLLENNLVLENSLFSSVYSQAKSNSNNVLLLDQNNYLRATYAPTEEGIQKLDKDIQHLMIETFSANSKSDRIFD